MSKKVPRATQVRPVIQPQPVTPVTPVAPVAQVTLASTSQTLEESTPIIAQVAKFTDYRCFYLPNLKNIYLNLLNDNITHLIGHIYNNMNSEPYNSPDVRISLSMQMILSSNKLIPANLASKIAKDIDDLRKDVNYTSKWADPTLKRKKMTKELETLRKHTEIDDNISLNLADTKDPEIKVDDFDLHSTISTLNVSSSCPVEAGDINEEKCSLM